MIDLFQAVADTNDATVYDFGMESSEKCQSLKRAAWIDARTEDLLDVEYFHVVFTVPQDVAALAAQNKATVYNLLFRATAETLRTIAADPGILVPSWGSLRCSTPGGRRSSRIPICTV